MGNDGERTEPKTEAQSKENPQSEDLKEAEVPYRAKMTRKLGKRYSIKHKKK